MDVRRLWMATLGLGLALAAPSGAQAAGLIAAYDRYEPGKGFELGLVDLGTGATIALPAGVNTADDELHPGLSTDGRYLTFVRMRLLPKLNGDIVPPDARTVFILDRQTGTVTAQGTGSGVAAGPSFADRATRTLSWGSRPAGATSTVMKLSAVGSDNTVSGSTGFVIDLGPVPQGHVLDVPHVSIGPGSNRHLSWIHSNTVSGAIATGTTSMTATGARADFTGASHPAIRTGDGYVAVDRTSGADADVESITFPQETALTPAPSPITTGDPERMPAWSPGGLQLGFVRTTGGRRKIGVYDLTPGLQTILNPLADIGPDAPTPQTRAFQSAWGGLSISEGAEAPAATCTVACLQALRTRITTVRLRPSVTALTQIGIFVARVTGKRKLLGRTVPRIKVVGRVPLGAARKGRNTFRWNGKVAGKRLKRGTYLLTYRALRGKRVVSTSGSIRFKVAKGGRIRGVKRLR